MPARIWRVVVSIVLLVAAGTKVLDPSALARVLMWDGVPVRWLLPAVWTIVLLEVTVVSLLISVQKPWTIVAALVLFMIFTLQLMLLLKHPQSPPCGCITLIRDGGYAQPGEHRTAIIRNAIFIVSGIAVLCSNAIRSQHLHNGLQEIKQRNSNDHQAPGVDVA